MKKEEKKTCKLCYPAFPFLLLFFCSYDLFFYFPIDFVVAFVDNVAAGMCVWQVVELGRQR